MRRSEKGEKVQLKGGICEVNFGYNVKKEVYPNSSSDIPKLGDMSSDDKILKTRYLIAKDVIYVQC